MNSKDNLDYRNGNLDILEISNVHKVGTCFQNIHDQMHLFNSDLFI